MKKTLIITGGNDGLGRELVKQFSSNHNVIILAKDDCKSEKVAKEFCCQYYHCDLTNIESLKNAFEKIGEDFETIDCLINCAGVWLQGNIEENTLEQIKNVLDVNTFGTIACTQLVVPTMKKQKFGQIINVTSQSAVVIEEFCPIYCASKHAITTFRECVQNDLATYNIRMTNVAPGLMQTNLFEKAGNHIPEEIMQKCGAKLSDVAKQIKELVDMDENIWIPALEIKSKNNIGKS